ncbi:hypothetical protein [Mucilaginibacter sp.]
MKTQLKNRTLALVTVVILMFFQSCEFSSLSRNDAKAAIDSYLKKQNSTLLVRKSTIYAVVRGQGQRYYDELNLIKPFISAGLLKFKRKETRPDTDPIYWYIYTVTEKGKPYIINQEWSDGDYPVYHVKQYDLNVGDITGIQFSNDNKQALVDFYLSKQNITPFGELSVNQDSKIGLQAEFDLYDDGWRLEKMSGAN